MIAELPQMVRDAVGEAIRALPADVRTSQHQLPATHLRPKMLRRAKLPPKKLGKKAATKKAPEKETPKKKKKAKRLPKKTHHQRNALNM